MTIRLVRLLVMGGAALLASCALFNPYVQSIAPETKTATGSQLASKIRMELQGKTNGLAYWQSGSSLALAGALGLGGYKAVTAGNGDQVAALAAGSASLYGFSAAQYKPTREQLYHRGVQAVMCVESIYERASLEEGNELIRRIAQLKAGSGAVSITNAYSLYGAISRAKAFDRVYKEKLVEIVAALNNYLAALQPAPEVTYRIISDAIGSRPVPPPDGTKNAWSAGLAPISINGRFNAQQQLQAALLADEANEWIARIYTTAPGFDSDAPGCNPFQGQVPSIKGLPSGSTLDMVAGGQERFLILNSSGDLRITYATQDSSDQGAAEIRVITENRSYWVEVKALRQTQKPLKAYLTDSQKGEVTIDFYISISAAPAAGP